MQAIRTGWLFFQDQILGMKWLNALIGSALEALGVWELTPDAMRKTAGFVLKNSEDLNVLEEDDQPGHEGCGCGGQCEGHHHG